MTTPSLGQVRVIQQKTHVASPRQEYYRFQHVGRGGLQPLRMYNGGENRYGPPPCGPAGGGNDRSSHHGSRSGGPGLKNLARLKQSRLFSDAGLPLAVTELRQIDLALHRHDFTELVIVSNGTGDQLFDDENFPIIAGDAFVIDVEHAHGYRNTSGLQIANVMFDEPFLLEREPSLAAMPSYQALVHLEPMARHRLGFAGKLRLDSRTMAEVRRLLGRLSEELSGRREGFAGLAVALLVELIVLLCRAYAAADSEPHRDLTDIGRVIGFLENHYAEEIEISDLLDVVAMSERSLLRKFSVATGTTPIQHLLRVRIAHGALLLRTSALPVTEIAGLVGFQSSNYFSRQFRRIYGTSPREYRREQEY